MDVWRDSTHRWRGRHRRRTGGVPRLPFSVAVRRVRPRSRVSTFPSSRKPHGASPLPGGRAPTAAKSSPLENHGLDPRAPARERARRRRRVSSLWDDRRSVVFYLPSVRLVRDRAIRTVVTSSDDEAPEESPRPRDPVDRDVALLEPPERDRGSAARSIWFPPRRIAPDSVPPPTMFGAMVNANEYNCRPSMSTRTNGSKILVACEDCGNAYVGLRLGDGTIQPMGKRTCRCGKDSFRQIS